MDADVPDSPDAFEASDGFVLFSVRGILSMLCLRAWSGIAFIEMGLPSYVAIPLSLAVGFLALYLTALLMKQMLKLHQFAIMCAPTASQLAAIEALANGDEDIQCMSAEYDRRRKYLISRLREMGIPCFEPKGAFYVFPNISGFGMTSEEFCQKLLYDYGVAIVPGTAFGDCGEGFARISYAYSLKHLNEALSRIEQMVAELKQTK
jgi:aspartate/methionine/tyrosine aminotransferase